MLLKFSNFVSIFALYTILASTVTTPTWAMEDMPIEVAIPIARMANKKPTGGWPDYKSLEGCKNFRLTSKHWKIAADDVLKKDKLLKITLKPEDYKHPGLEAIAPFVARIYIKENHENTNFQEVGEILSKYDFSNLISFEYMGSFARHRLDMGQEIADFAPCLSKFTNLETLNIIAIGVGEKGGKAIGKILPYLPNLRILYVGMTDLGPLGTKKLIKGLTNHEKLENLSLAKNGVGDIGCVALADKLKKLKGLREVFMAGVIRTCPGGESRFIQEAGQQYFEEMVKKYNPNLKYTFQD